MALSWLQPACFFPATGDTQHRDSERIENGNRIRVCIVIQLCIAIVILYLCCDFSVLLYQSAKSKSCVTSSIFK